jgi:adenylate cyclase, class 2
VRRAVLTYKKPAADTASAEAGVAAALGDVRTVLCELGIGEDDLTTEQYTDAVMRARA